MSNVTLGWVQLAATVGALQGLFLGGVLLAQGTNRTANRLLALLVLEFSLYLASGPYYTAGLIRAYPHFFGVSYHTTWVFGPLVYLYARAASDRSWRFTLSTLWHFVPVTIALLLMAPAYFLSGAEKIALYDQWAAHGITAPLKYIDPFRYVSGIVYSAATMLHVQRHRRDMHDNYSNMERVNLRWLLWFSGATGGIWFMATTFKVLRVPVPIRDGYISTAMALLVYGIGYMGLRQPEILRFKTEELKIPTPDDEILRAAVVAIMEVEKPWKDSELTLSDLAAKLNTTPHKLSEVLNSRVGQTFYDFVNGYRVREVQRRIKAGDARSLKMLALAMDAGFASKSTFNEVFKKHTNQTPSDFRQATGA